MSCQHAFQPKPDDSPKGFKRDSTYVPSAGCQYPIRMGCIFCNFVKFFRCKSVKEEKCVYCSRIAKSQRIQQFTEALNSVDYRIELTVTAPGKAVLPWDKSFCTHRAGIKCEGPIGCRVSDATAHYWNSTFTSRYNDFITHLRKKYPDLKIEYGNAREQKRELLHQHAQFIFPEGAPVDLHKFSATVKKLLLHHGFGEQSSVKVKRGNVGQAVRYAVKYMTKGSMRAITYDFKRERYQRGGYQVFTRSRGFGRSLKAIGLNRYEVYCATVLAKATSLLASQLGATPISAAEGGPNGPPLDSTYTRSYAISP